MESRDSYRCPQCPRVGSVKELETHLAEDHYHFFPHHCRTCGKRTYDKAAIYEQCVSLKHKVVFWEVREEEQEGQLAMDLEECLSHPVLLIEQKMSLSSDADSILLTDNGDSGLVNAGSNFTKLSNSDFVNANLLVPPQPPQTKQEAMEADKVEITVVASTKRRVLLTNQGRKRPYKRCLDPQIHTVITCHYTGCGEEIALRGKQDVSDTKKRHIHERHLKELAQSIRCPVMGCVKAKLKGNFTHIKGLASHIQYIHHGVDALKAGERVSLRVTQKRMLDACRQLIPVCFPPGAIRQDEAKAKKTRRCAVCKKNVKALLAHFGKMQRRHVETRHMEAGNKISCPVMGCTSSRKEYDNCINLRKHIDKCHAGINGLSEEQKFEFRALRKESKAATNVLFAQCFPDND